MDRECVSYVIHSMGCCLLHIDKVHAAIFDKSLAATADVSQMQKKSRKRRPPPKPETTIVINTRWFLAKFGHDEKQPRSLAGVK